MNFIKLYIIRLAYSWIAKKHDEQMTDLDWTPEDSTVLDEFLKTEPGKKFLALMGENSNNALRQVMNAKNDAEVQNVKAQAKVWLALKGNLQTLRIQKRDIKSRKLSNEKLEEMFSKMVSSSITVTRHAMRKA